MSNGERIYYVNNEGSGFADNVDVPSGTTIADFFRERMSGKAPSSYVIRVNGNSVPSSHVLRTGDQVSITPAKIQGARLAA